LPEGDTVWRSALQLDRALSGSTLLGTDFRVPALAAVDLAGRQVESTLARGKHLLTRIGTGPGTGTGLTLHTHLRMEGAWLL
jgi:endonuclease VIII